METKTIIILTILSTILTLLMYYGIIRYFKLLVSGCQSYVKSYTLLDKASKNRTVVSLRVNSSDTETIIPTINSLLDSSVRVDEIMLYTYNKDLTKTECITNYINVYKASETQKFIEITQILYKETDANTIVILLESGMIYGYDLIEQLTDLASKNDNSLIYVGNEFSTRQGILVKPSFFNPEIVNVPDDFKGSAEDWILQNLKPEIKKISLSYNENYKDIL